jgi:hypothetical protein
MNLAPCGIDCNTCKQRPKDCDGCHAQSDHLWCSDCKIRVCCLFDKKLDNCSLCGEFPCQAILAFESDKWVHHRKAVKRLREMRQGM